MSDVFKSEAQVLTMRIRKKKLMGTYKRPITFRCFIQHGNLLYCSALGITVHTAHGYLLIACSY